MPGRIEVRTNETIEQALRRLSNEVRHASRRKWYKTRPGSYEKLSDRRRRKECLRIRNARRHAWGVNLNSTAAVYLTLRQLLSPFDPFAPVSRKERRARKQAHRKSHARGRPSRSEQDADDSWEPTTSS